MAKEKLKASASQSEIAREANSTLSCVNNVDYANMAAVKPETTTSLLPEFEHRVVIGSKLYLISQKRLETRAKYIASHHRTFYPTAIQARKEWIEEGGKISSYTEERAAETATCYYNSEMSDIIYNYVLRHPKVVVELDIKFRRKTNVRKFFGMAPKTPISNDKLKDLEVVMKYLKTNKVKNYKIDENNLYIQAINGQYVPVKIASITGGMRYV